MSTYYQQGDTPEEVGLNAPYVNVAALTIKSNNCDENWITRKHFNVSGLKINQVFNVSASGGTIYSTTSGTFSTVTNGSTNAVITLNETVNTNTLFRFNWDTLIGDNICTNDGRTSGYSFNIYAFRVKVLLNSGAVTKYVSSAAYSYTARSASTIRANRLTEAINWRSCGGTGLLNVATGDTIDSVTLEAATGGGGVNTLKVVRFNMNVVRSKQ